MHLRYRLVLPLVALCVALAAPAFAGKLAPNTKPTPVSASLPFQVGRATGTSAACQMGVLGPAIAAYGYLFPPNDQYYTYLDPVDCPSCSGNAYLFTNAHVQLYYTQSCQIPVFVSIVGADVSDPYCPRPNPYDVICPEVQYVLGDAGVLNQCIDFSLPLPASCCVNRPAFLELRFETGSCPDYRPEFCYGSSCENCRQYNIYPGSPPGGDDECAVLAPNGFSSWIMYAEATCCQATPTLPGTWGKMKTLYR
jgi:hypothetical protein